MKKYILLALSAIIAVYLFSSFVYFIVGLVALFFIIRHFSSSKS